MKDLATLTITTWNRWDHEPSPQLRDMADVLLNHWFRLARWNDDLQCLMVPECDE